MFDVSWCFLLQEGFEGQAGEEGIVGGDFFFYAYGSGHLD